MTEATEKKEEEAAPEKLMIDDTSDFQFHAAYLAYSDAFDKRTDAKSKQDLNKNIEALRKGKLDYATFYSNVNQYRMGTGNEPRHTGLFLKTQRKKDWRRATQKSERIRRHRK